MGTTLEMKYESLGRVEGELDIKCKIEDGVVTEAWTEGTMFRGFEIILKGKDPQAGLIVTPRICGICGGSHLTKAVYALDVAWKTEVPPNAHLIRSIAQACETLQSIPRWFYALFGIDLVHKKYANSPLYDEAVRRWAPFVGESYDPGVTLSNKPVEIYAIFGGQWPHSSFMIPGGVMCAPTLVDVTRSRAILEFWKNEWLEKYWLGCTIERYMEIKTWEDMLEWIEEDENHRNSDLGFFIRYCMDIGLDKYGVGPQTFLACGTYIDKDHYKNPDIESRNDALICKSGVYDGENFHDYDQANVYEDHTYSFFRGSGMLHPFDGVTDPLDPQEAAKDGKYTWAKAPRYHLNGKYMPMETGPYARQIMAGRPGGHDHQDNDPFVYDMHTKLGASIMTRVLGRMHEGPKLLNRVKGWLDDIDLHEKFYIKPTEHKEGRGYGGTEASRGALQDWITIEDGKIKNYQVITPTGWTIGPRDGSGLMGPMEQAICGTPISDPDDPVEIGHVVRSYDSCLVCTVHAYDAKTNRELAKFKIGGGC
ncbi:MAG: nickel-dependent hydrogenase large subunit [Phycisphaerales bacterium]|nr:nickel-dependent hydrogenase large subunit [Phycisphaerales bacterium]